ncbi:hypothetical protein EPA93_04660 [Ktedonosporobacter rubrisoli]|uniref:Uncharacterized protein n=1 Tax=Ktedonosporobacter rubrisoli TaxID=2509675 RepID=A0A4P6JKY7_KTERU|nr:hypothetical protein [Ktedonosporobacter rubrisoli]QBD75326.1 hypothetical protein EPA93_04660 [Ktedonosporobacter rubrisoli]
MAVFGDMQLIGKIYRLQLALLPIGDHFALGPHIELLGVKDIIPTQVLSGTQQALAEATRHMAGLTLHVMQPGETLDTDK